MEIKIAGTGCPKCKATERIVKEVVQELNVNVVVEHIYDPKEFIKMGVTLTPAVLIDDRIVIEGKVPSKEEVIEILNKVI